MTINSEELERYCVLFDLTPSEVNTRILEFGYGPTAIQKTLKNFKHQVVHCDPLFPCPLPFADFSFDFALCAHYLFDDSGIKDIAYHLNVLRELARVAKEIRIYPIDKAGQVSPLLGPVLLGLQQENYGAEVRQVETSPERLNHALLRVWAQQCAV